jgi:hypothetical protein
MRSSGATITWVALSALHITLPFDRLNRRPPRSRTLLSGAHFAFRLMIHRAERARIVSPICFFLADPQIVSTCANTASIFPDHSALRSPRLPAAHHLENASIPSLWSQFLPLRSALHPPLCAAPPSPAVRSLALRFHHAPSAPEFLHPPLRRFFIHSSEFSLAPDERFRYVSIHSYTLSAQLRKRDHCQRLRKGRAKYKDWRGGSLRMANGARELWREQQNGN